MTQRLVCIVSLHDVLYHRHIIFLLCAKPCHLCNGISKIYSVSFVLSIFFGVRENLIKVCPCHRILSWPRQFNLIKLRGVTSIIGRLMRFTYLNKKKNEIGICLPTIYEISAFMQTNKRTLLLYIIF